ncbi:MAG TPA: type II toxin-antitoxin system VapC family toxin [Tepidisphaeraceae bacterium]|jgi:predicted nucleic acid-binding protein|nr:type II toxin-antitoxin system VapC family toxin [Tepidisphaeraceae bacterium]
MAVLIDTGVLLRIPNRNDPLHLNVRAAFRGLQSHGEQLVATLQNMSEFWNVCTRPASARGGFGLTIEQAEKRLRLLERLVTILPDPPALYERWREIVLSHRVSGVQVHDAKLVAGMALHGIGRILTLNPADFRRYSFVSVITP